MLAAGGGALAVGLAGCPGTGDSGNGNGNGGNGNGGNGNGNGNGGNGNGNGGNGNGNGGNGNGGDVPTFSTPVNGSPQDTHHNPFNPGQAVGLGVIRDPLFEYNWFTGEYHSRIGEELQIEGTTATLNMNPDMSWSNGDPVVAEDLVTQYDLMRFNQSGVWNFLEGVEAVDETTVEFQLTEEFNPDVFIDILDPGMGIVVKRGGEFADWVEQFEEGDVESVREEFASFEYQSDEHDPAANGPYHVSGTESGRWILERNENYPVVTNITDREGLVVSGDQDIWQLMISGRIDGRELQAVEQQIEKEMPEWLKKVEIPVADGLAPMWNMHEDVYAKREFRQAMAFLISRKEVDRNVNPRHTAAKHVTGLTNGLSDIWLGDSFLDSLTQYGMESKPDKAAEKMREAGFTKESGKWLDESGDVISVEWSTPGWPGGIGVGETLRSTLPSFGIEYSSTTMEVSQFFSARAELDYDFAFNSLLGGPHPYFFAENVLEAPTTEQAGFPVDSVELPPKGQPDGSPQSFDLQQMFTSLARLRNEDELTSVVEDYAWYFNQELPYFQLTSAVAPSFIATNQWEIPSLDSDVMGLLGPANELFRESAEGSDQALIQGKTN